MRVDLPDGKIGAVRFRRTVITYSDLHVIDGALDVVPVSSREMCCIVRISPSPVFVEEDDLRANALLSSQRACLRS